MVTRRTVLQASMAAAIAAGTPMGWVIRQAGATALPASVPLADPAWLFDNNKAFTTDCPDAMAPSFVYTPNRGKYNLMVSSSTQDVGLVDSNGNPLGLTDVWGYGPVGGTPTWPGMTFEVKRNDGVKVYWENMLSTTHVMDYALDTSLHWCYALHGYTDKSIGVNGVPIVTHLHGGHTDYQWDGNPEFFYGPQINGSRVVGPQWADVPQGFSTEFRYDTDVPAGTLWYHDHALGITRLNVYAGMAGFFIVRDDVDTGKPGNAADLPVWPYEKLYAIQDRMFTDGGSLFLPAYPGDPYYDDFITGEEAVLPDDIFPNGGPTAMAEFFGDHMIVNGKAWPKEVVEPRNYRMRLLNGTDSRFMALEFWAVPAGKTDFTRATGPLPFHVIGSDQGLASSPTATNVLLSEPGSRYDVIFDFGMPECAGKRIILRNKAGDSPFGGVVERTAEDFEFTDRVMAFDVEENSSRRGRSIADVSPIYKGNSAFSYRGTKGKTDRVRKVALFEGKDEFGRLQPLLGTAEPATDFAGNPIMWPDTDVYSSVGLTGQMEGSIAWHSPTTENPALDTIEDWEIFNMTGDAHPVHLHLVNFEILGRKAIKFDSNADEDGFIPAGSSPAGDGTYLVPQTTVQHNSEAGKPETYGKGFRIVNPTTTGPLMPPSSMPGYVENAPKDMVTALPGEVTIVKAKFDKPGRYVWHCHILSHEDHEMMRVMEVSDEGKGKGKKR